MANKKTTSKVPTYIIIIQVLLWVASAVLLVNLIFRIAVYYFLQGSNNDLVTALGGLSADSYLNNIAVPLLFFVALLSASILITLYANSYRYNRKPRIQRHIYYVVTTILVFALFNVVYGYKNMDNINSDENNKNSRLQSYVEADYGGYTIDTYNTMWWQPSIMRSTALDPYGNDADYCQAQKTAGTFEFYPDQIDTIDETNEAYIRYIDGYGDWEWDFISSETTNINGNEFKIMKYNDSPLAYQQSICGKQDIYVSTYRDDSKVLIVTYTTKESTSSDDDNKKFLYSFSNL